VSASDIKIREQVIAVKSGAAEGMSEGAYAQMLHGLLFVEVLAAMGHPITEAMLEEEIRRIDQSTHDPQGLADLKKACGGGDSPSYRRIGILPDFANRVFSQQVYPRAKELQSDRRVEAEKLLKELSRSAVLENEVTPIPANSPWQRSISLFSPQLGFEPMSGPGDPPIHRPDAPVGESRWLAFERDYLIPVEMGKFCSSVIEMDDRFLLLRWIQWEDQNHRVRRVEQLWLPKRSPSEYFLEKASAIPVWIADPAIAESLRQKVSWARSLSWRRP